MILLAAAVKVLIAREDRIVRVAEAFTVTYTAARQLVDGEVRCGDPLRFRAPADVDRWMHRRGMRP